MLCRNDRSQISYTHYLQDTPVVVVYITTVCTRHDREKPSSSLEKISSVQPSNSHTTHIHIHITSHHITPSSLPRTELSNSNWPTLIEQSTIPYRARPRVLASWLPGSLVRIDWLADWLAHLRLVLFLCIRILLYYIISLLSNCTSSAKFPSLNVLKSPFHSIRPLNTFCRKPNVLRSAPSKTYYSYILLSIFQSISS